MRAATTRPSAPRRRRSTSAMHTLGDAHPETVAALLIRALRVSVQPQPRRGPEAAESAYRTAPRGVSRHAQAPAHHRGPLALRPRARRGRRAGARRRTARAGRQRRGRRRSARRAAWSGSSRCRSRIPAGDRSDRRGARQQPQGGRHHRATHQAASPSGTPPPSISAAPRSSRRDGPTRRCPT